MFRLIQFDLSIIKGKFSLECLNHKNFSKRARIFWSIRIKNFLELEMSV